MSNLLGGIYGRRLIVSKFTPNVLDHIDRIPIPRRHMSRRIKVYVPPFYVMADMIITNPEGEALLLAKAKLEVW